MKVFVHVALDRYGACSLARAQSLLGGGAAEGELHLCAWAGMSPPPVPSDVWDQSVPRWDDIVAWPIASAEAAPFEVDRQAMADAVRSFLTSVDGATVLDRLLRAAPTERLGSHQAVEPVIIFAGSLADPASSGVLLGCLSGLARLRHLGRWNCPIYVVAGTGVESGPITTAPEKARVLVAQALLDLERFITEASPTSDRAAQVLLAGEHSALHQLTDRTTQVSLAALTIAGLAKSAAASPDSASHQVADPFMLEVDLDGRVIIAGDTWDPAHPLAAVGAYGVSSPTEPLARLLAARMCADWMTLLADQEVVASLAAATDIVVSSAASVLLGDLEARITAQVLSGTGVATPPAAEARPAAIFDMTSLDRVFGSVFESRTWEQALAAYGEDRLRVLPLDDWPAALDDLTSVIEHSLLAARRQQVVEDSRTAVVNLLNGLDEAVSEIFAGVFSNGVGQAPHRTAQALLGRLASALAARRRQVRQLELAEPSRPSEEDLRQKAAETLAGLKGLLQAVPSPVAVWLRTLPIVGVAVALVQLLPFSLGLVDTPLARLGFGIGIGTLASLWLFLSRVDLVRRQLTGEFRRWLSDYRSLLEELDHKLRGSSRHQLLDAADALLQWYFNGTEQAPPLPEGLRVPLGGDSAVRDSDQAACLSRQDVLSSSAPRLRAAALQFEELALKFLQEYQPSACEMVLPDIGPGRTNELDHEYALVVGSDGVEGLLARMRDWCRQGGPEAAGWFLPFEESPGSGYETGCPAWRRDLRISDKASIPVSEGQRPDAGFLLFDTARRFIVTQIEDRSNLSLRLTDYGRHHEPTVLHATPLGDRYFNLSQPATMVSGAPVPLALIAGPSDPLALGAGHVRTHEVPTLSARLHVRHCLSAEDVIFFPNDEQPATPIGKAWRAHRETPQRGAAFEPVVLPGDDAP